MATLGVVAHDVSLGPTEVVLRGRDVQLEWTARYSVHIADILRALSQQFPDQHQEANPLGQPPLAEDLVQAAAEAATDAGTIASAWQALGESELVSIGQGLAWEELSGPPKIKAQPKATMQKVVPRSEEDTAESMPPAQEVPTKAKKPKAKKTESEDSGQLAETSASQELASRLKHPPPLQPPPPVPTKVAPAKAKMKASSATPATGSGPVQMKPSFPSQDVGAAGGSGRAVGVPSAPPPPPPIEGVASHAPVAAAAEQPNPPRVVTAPMELPPPPPPGVAAHAPVAAAADPPLEPPPPPPIGGAAAAAADPPAPPVAKGAAPARFGTGASPANTQAARVQGQKQLECKTQ